jgi:ubiquinone/menaquinone biosynthesis C-methylase UbiE
MPAHPATLESATALILVEDGNVRGYLSSSYGDAFADVYDDWYRDISDVPATVAFLAALASPTGTVLELGVGTGRLAVPLAAQVGRVVGIDSSEKMLERLAHNDPDRTVHTMVGDMVDDLPDTSSGFDVVLTAYNTLFNLLTAERQQACFTEVARRLVPGGSFVVEAFVPQAHTGSQVSVRSMAADRVVLSASVHQATGQRAEGQFIEFTEAGGVRLRPWAIRWAMPDELDTMAGAAGLELTERWADFDRSGFDDTSERHVSVYRRPAHGGRGR